MLKKLKFLKYHQTPSKWGYNEATEVVEAVEVIEAAEIIRPEKSLLRSLESSRFFEFCFILRF